MFIVFHSRNKLEFVETYDVAQRTAKLYNDGMCKKLNGGAQEAEFWKQRVAAIAPHHVPNAKPVYASGFYRTDDDHDSFAGISVVIDKVETAEKTLCEGTHHSELCAIVRALELAENIPNIIIFTTSKHVLFGLHYGFRCWPKLQPDANYGNKYQWARIEQLLSEREMVGFTCTFDFGSTKMPCSASGIAHSAATDPVGVDTFCLFRSYTTNYFANMQNQEPVKPAQN